MTVTQAPTDPYTTAAMAEVIRHVDPRSTVRAEDLVLLRHVLHGRQVGHDKRTGSTYLGARA